MCAAFLKVIVGIVFISICYGSVHGETSLVLLPQSPVIYRNDETVEFKCTVQHGRVPRDYITWHWVYDVTANSQVELNRTTDVAYANKYNLTLTHSHNGTMLYCQLKHDRQEYKSNVVMLYMNTVKGSIDLSTTNEASLYCYKENDVISNLPVVNTTEIQANKVGIYWCPPPEQPYVSALQRLKIDMTNSSELDIALFPTEVPLRSDHFRGLQLRKLSIKSLCFFYKFTIEPCAYMYVIVIDNSDAENYVFAKELNFNGVRLPRLINTNTAEKIVLENGYSTGIWGQCGKLQSLIVTKWRIPDTEPWLVNCRQLSELKLKLVSYEDIVSALRNVTTLHVLTILETEIRELPLKLNVMHNLSKLRELKMNHNKLQKIDRDTFNSLPMLEVLDLSHNELLLQDLKGILTPLHMLREFSLANNHLVTEFEVSSPDASSGFIDNCSVRYFYGDTEPQLQIMSTFMTGLAEVCPHLAEPLKTLDLPHYKLKEKKVINLAYSYISRVSKRTVKAIFADPDRRLWFAKNPLICDCDSGPLLDALYLHQTQVPDYKQVTCINTGKCVDEVQLEDLCGPTPEQLALIATITLSAALLFIVVSLTVFYYRHQQAIKAFLYARGYNLWFVREEELDANRLYDAFISFAHSDEELVAEQLLPKLEHEYKLCVHTRDWIPGEMIHMQIVRSVEQSRRTIILLSRKFLESVWGMVEFRTAYTTAVQEGRARIIVIVLDEEVLKKDNLDSDLRSYLRTNTYVKWSDRWFWEKLKYALPHQQHSDMSLLHKISPTDIVACK